MAFEGIIITAFMGIGKSTVGPKVAERLGLIYSDTDDWMEAAGIDIPHLVKTDMAEFRRLEVEALKAILEQEPGVASTGGGIVSTGIGRTALIESAASVVFLKAPFRVAVEHVAGDTGRERPLFANKEVAHALFDERQPWYEGTADYTVDADQPIEQVVEAVVSIVGQ